MSKPHPSLAPAPPGGTIGILGGGQLGRMLALASARLGLKSHIYSDEQDAPAFQVSTARTIGRYDDEESLSAFAASCDVVTFEFENVPSAAASLLARLKPTNPNAAALAIAQDRLDEKTFVRSLGIGTAPFAAVDSVEAAEAAFRTMNGLAVLKTRRFGYDGKGQEKISTASEAARAFRAFRGVPMLMEGFVPFAFEVSVIAARARDGNFSAYDPPENLHGDHILRRSVVPSRLSAPQAEEAKAIARKIAEALDYVGVLCVEMFVTQKGELLVNEFAPRVHNSGHWTLEACLTSQFEQHIRAIAGWTLGPSERHSDAVMENIIGEEARDWQRLAASGGALHLYGKSEIRPGRKMGHITRLRPKT